MEPRVKGNRLIRNPEITIELFNLTAQSGEVVSNASGIADIVVRAEKAFKRGFDERRFADAGPLGRLRQPCGHPFAEINANSGLHDGHSLGDNRLTGWFEGLIPAGRIGGVSTILQMECGVLIDLAG